MATAAEPEPSYLDRLNELYADITRTARVVGAGAVDIHALDQFCMLARQGLTEQAAEIARLKAELDAATPDRLVLMCMDRNLADAMNASRHEEPGTILRTTDTSKTWELGPDKTWRPRP
jgi:hypothetical protein